MDSNSAWRGQRPEEHITHDPMIISRVRTYLYENEDTAYIDVTEMANYLQRTYRDYQSIKRGSFRTMVRNAYNAITQNATRQIDPHWQDNDDDDEIDIEIDTVPVKYKLPYKPQAPERPNGNSDGNELIDISSDDDQEQTTRTAMGNKPEEDMEMIQISKRPHLSPSIEITRCQQVQEPQEVETHSKFCNKGENSRKRHRNKDMDIESAFDNNIRKRTPRDVSVVKPKIKFSDMGGITKVLEVIANLLIHMKHPEVYSKLGISPPRGFLLHGPPGCGKTLLAHAIAGELTMPLLKVSALELVAGVSGESELRVRELFEQAVAFAPCILFLDEIDAVNLHRASAQKEMDNIVSQLLSCLDALAQNTKGNKVLVIGATSKPDSVDPALRRAGRFDREISLGIPDKEARAAILGVHTAGVTLSPDVDLHKIASLTSGFVGADLVALIREAAMAAVNRTFQNLEKSPSNDVEIYIVVSEIPKSPNENEATEADKEKQPVPNNEIENTDIIIDDDSPVQANSTEKPEEEKADASSEVVPTVLMANEEEQKTAEDPPDITEPSKSSAMEPMAPSSPTIAAEDPQPELAVQTETTDVPISSPKETEQPVAAAATEEITIDSEPMKMQVEEEKKSDSKEKLADLLTWLKNDSPLTSEQLAQLCIEVCDFEVALKNVQSTAKREGFATVPNVSWEDIGALQEIRQELQMTILAPMRYAERFDSFGLNAPTGVLLCGPPGCGKTLLAKAIANEAGISFISVKGSDLLNAYVVESEKAVHQCFLRARNAAPCIIFFDELDALCPRRAECDNTATSRVVNQMLAEMDGVEGRKDFFLMAASNRPEIIDPSVLRPGRLDKILYVGLPNALDRVDILRALTKNGTKPQLAKDISLQEIAEKSEGYTGADLAGLVREACIENLRESMAGLITPAEICQRHFNAAFDKIRPSMQEKDVRHYDKLHKLFSVKRNQHVDIPMSLDPPVDTIIEAMET